MTPKSQKVKRRWATVCESDNAIGHINVPPLWIIERIRWDPADDSLCCSECLPSVVYRLSFGSSKSEGLCLADNIPLVSDNHETSPETEVLD